MHQLELWMHWLVEFMRANQQWALPITESVAAVLRSELSPSQALSQLMRRELRCE